MTPRTDHPDTTPEGTGLGLTGVPMWAKIVAVLGFPMAVASWLIWFVTGTLSASLADIGTVLKQQQAVSTQQQIVLEGLAKSIDEHLRQSNAQAGDLLRMTTATCVSVSRNCFGR